MNTLREKLKKSSVDTVSELKIFDLKVAKQRGEVLNLFKAGEIVSVVDEYATQIRELNQVKNPRLLTKNIAEKNTTASSINEGKWIYYPWAKTLVHLLNPKEFKMLRLSRNNPLITGAEQEKLGRARIGIAGLNVGNPVAICMALEGIGSEVRYADNDHVSLSN